MQGGVFVDRLCYHTLAMASALAAVDFSSVKGFGWRQDICCIVQSTGHLDVAEHLSSVAHGVIRLGPVNSGAASTTNTHPGGNVAALV